MRQRQAGSHLSDAQVAHSVRMLMRDDLDHEAVCVMARDRICYLSAALEDLTRQLRAEEITGINIRLRTIRECAELMDLHNASGSGGLAIREKFGVPA